MICLTCSGVKAGGGTFCGVEDMTLERFFKLFQAEFFTLDKFRVRSHKVVHVFTFLSLVDSHGRFAIKNAFPLGLIGKSVEIFILSTENPKIITPKKSLKSFNLYKSYAFVLPYVTHNFIASKKQREGW